MNNKLDVFLKNGEIMKEIHDAVKNYIKIGINILSIDNYIGEFFKKYNLIKIAEEFGYQYYSCISVDDCICHGEPNKFTIIRDNSIISIDIFFKKNNYCVDCCRTYIVSKNKECSLTINLQKLIDYNKFLVFQSINKANEILLSDKKIKYSFFGNFIDDMISKSDYSISMEYGGHKIGSKLHESYISMINNENNDFILDLEAFCIEPIICYKSNINSNNKYFNSSIRGKWSVFNNTGQQTSHYEDTFILSNNQVVKIT